MDEKEQPFKATVETGTKEEAPESAAELLKRLGFESEDDLKAAIGNSQSYEAMKLDYDRIVGEGKTQKEAYDKLKSDYDALGKAKHDLEGEILLRDKGIRKERYDDTLTWFKGKGIEMDEKSLTDAIKTHPEWTGGSFGGGERKTPTPDEKDIQDQKAAQDFGLPGFFSIGGPRHG